MKNFIKRMNLLRWLEFQREAVILFANLKRNKKAYEHLDKICKAYYTTGYILGMLVIVFIMLVLSWVL